VLGILGDFLLRGLPWGLGAAVWTFSLVIAAVVVAHRYGNGAFSVRWMWLPAMFAVFIVWRDSPSLRGWNVLTFVAAMTFAALPAVGTCLRSSGVWVYCRNAAGVLLKTLFGVTTLPLGDKESGTGLGEEAGPLFKPVLRGTLLAAPLALIFSALLMSADPVFERLVRSTTAWNFSEAVSHLLVVGLLAWLVSGLLWGLVAGSHPLEYLVDRVIRPSVGIVEVGIVLGSLVVLFLLFVVIQIEYLFGGEGLILAAEGMGYAEYARSGFFELVAVAALVVPVLLLANAVLVERDERDRQSYRALATVILILVALIMASAVQRMLLYTEAYGLTHDRFYASVFMGWIGTVLGLFAGTVLFGSGRNFVFAASLSGFAFMAALNFANPDALIARSHIARAACGRPIDVPYIASLSADAFPSVIDEVSVLFVEDRRMLLETMTRRLFYQRTDWRSWNVGRHRAKIAVSDQLFIENLKTSSFPLRQTAISP